MDDQDFLAAAGGSLTFSLINSNQLRTMRKETDIALSINVFQMIVMHV